MQFSIQRVSKCEVAKELMGFCFSVSLNQHKSGNKLLEQFFFLQFDESLILDESPQLVSIRECAGLCLLGTAKYLGFRVCFAPSRFTQTF